jgi:hypothetical protein
VQSISVHCGVCTLFIVANDYTGTSASDGIVLIESVAVPRAGRP